MRVAGPGSPESGIVLQMLVDTGADGSVIPVRIAGALGLPLVDRVQIQGVGGARQPTGVFAARVQIGAFDQLAHLIAFGDDPLLGRDLLNQLVLRFDGPKQAITVVLPGRSRRR